MVPADKPSQAEAAEEGYSGAPREGEHGGDEHLDGEQGAHHTGEEANDEQEATDDCIKWPASSATAAYSITSSARASSDGGMLSPRALAVFRLITSSNFVGCSTGMSPGFAPLRILSTYVAACRNRSVRLAQ